MLSTYDVPPVDGRICYLVESETRWSVTIECPSLCTAFQFDVAPKSKMAQGDWIRVSGKVRFDPGLRKDGTPVERNIGYRHEPHDGSPRKNWAFFFLLPDSVKWERVAPPEVAGTLKEVLESTRALLDGWDGVSAEMLQRTIRAWDRASAFMRPVLKARRIEEEDRDAVVKALDLKI